MRTEGIAQSFHLRKGLLSCFFSENRQEKNSDSSKHTALKYKKEEGVCPRTRAQVRLSVLRGTSVRAWAYRRPRSLKEWLGFVCLLLKFLRSSLCRSRWCGEGRAYWRCRRKW